MEVPAGEFKAKCLKMMDRVAERGETFVITKRGTPVARLVPVAEAVPVPLFGCLRGDVTQMGDLVSPIGDAWEAEK